MERLLSKREIVILGSKEYKELLNKELAKLYKEAEEWMSARGIKEYEDTDYGYKYYIDTRVSYRNEFKRARVEGTRNRVAVMRYFYDKNSRSNYGHECRWSREVDLDKVFMEANKAIYG